MCSGKGSVLVTHVVGKLKKSVGVSPLVIVPGDDLNESGAHLDSGIGVEDGRSGVVHEVGRHNGIFGVAEDVLEVGLGGFTHLHFNFIEGSVLVEADGEIDNGDVGGGDSEGHAGELTVELGDDFTDGLSGTGGGGDNVGSSSASSSPIFSSLGRSVNNKLVHGDGVDGSHEAFSNSPVVVEDLGDRGQAVGGARGVGDNVHVALVLIVVDSHHEHGGGVSGGARNNSFLGTSVQVESSGIGLGEDTGGFADEISSVLAPGDVAGVLLVGDSNEVSVNGDTTLGGLHIALKAS